MNLKSPVSLRLVAASLFAVIVVAFAVPALSMAATPAPRVPPVLKGAVGGKTTDKNKTLELVYGDDHVFGIVVPKGWVLDDTSGLGSRIRVVLYPKGQTWAKAPTVMYANPIHMPEHKHVSFETLIARDVAEFRKANPKGTVITAPQVTSAKGQRAQVRYFSPTGGKPLEAVAYFEQETLVQMIVLQARDAKGFADALPAYREMVGTYQFVGTGMQTPTGMK